MGSGKRFFIVLIFTLTSAWCFAQKPAAHFTSDCKILCGGSGLTGIGNNQVGFTYDGTGGTPTSYSWTFATGAPASSNSATPGTITFNNTGTHLVTVTATNASGSTSFTDTIFVTTCSANASVNVSTSCIGSCLNFFDKSTFRPDSWSWTFDVGTGTPITSYDQNPTNICYPKAGSFNVKLTSSRNNTCNNQANYSSNLVNIKNCPPVVFTINATKTSLCKGDCIDFTSHITSGTAPFTYSWQFLNGGVAGASTDSLPKGICYNNIGNNFVATLKVTDAVGKTSSENIAINVISCIPTAAFKAIQPICQGQCITFVDSSSAGSGGSITGYNWSFPSGGSITGSTSKSPPAVCYAAAGTYTATLTVTNPSGSSTPFSRSVVVNNCPPTANFTFTPDNFCQNGCATFTDHSIGGPGGRITSWAWAFQTSGAPIKYTKDSLPPPVCYTDPGTYTVGLVVTNASGQSTPFTQNVTVRYCPPPLNINFTTSSGQSNIPSNDVCRDSCIRITNNTTGATAYFWEFIYKDTFGVTHIDTSGKVNPLSNPGNPPTTPANCFAIPIDTGFIHIILFASSQDSTKTLDQLIHVHRCSGLFPALKASQENICAGDCISFLDKTTEQGGISPPVGWEWTFSGGSPATSTVQNPPYICYQDPGIYPVKLKVFNIASDGTTDSASVTYNFLITVNQAIQVGTNFDSTTVLQGTILQLLASGGVVYQWAPATNLDFALSDDPIFTSIDTGIYKYTVIMTDINGCSSSKTVTINVIPPDVVLVPNVFTPNTDHLNDYFDIYISGAYQSMELTIYDRWGEQIYTTNKPALPSPSSDVGWDGTYKGRPLSDGVYVYYYKVTFKDGTLLKKSGDVTLLR